MSSQLGFLPVWAWLLIAGAVVGYIGLYLWSISTPPEIAGVDVRPEEPATLTLTAPAAKLRVWGRYVLGTDDEDAEVRTDYEALSSGRVVAKATVGRVGARIWHGGKDDWESFTDTVATVREVEPGAPFELRVTIHTSAPVRSARIFVSL